MDKEKKPLKLQGKLPPLKPQGKLPPLKIPKKKIKAKILSPIMPKPKSSSGSSLGSAKSTFSNKSKEDAFNAFMNKISSSSSSGKSVDSLNFLNYLSNKSSSGKSLKEPVSPELELKPFNLTRNSSASVEKYYSDSSMEEFHKEMDPIMKELGEEIYRQEIAEELKYKLSWLWWEQANSPTEKALRLLKNEYKKVLDELKLKHPSSEEAKAREEQKARRDANLARKATAYKTPTVPTAPVPKKRGRPKGSKNKPKPPPS